MPSTSIPNKHKTPESELAKVDEEIRRRACDLYEQRGRRDGHDMNDWLKAEAEVTNKTKKSNRGAA